MSAKDKVRAAHAAERAEHRQARITQQAQVRRDREGRQQHTVAAQVAHARAASLRHANRKY